MKGSMDLIENKNKFMREFEELQQRDKLWNYCLKNMKKFSCKTQS